MKKKFVMKCECGRKLLKGVELEDGHKELIGSIDEPIVCPECNTKYMIVATSPKNDLPQFRIYKID